MSFLYVSMELRSPSLDLSRISCFSVCFTSTHQDIGIQLFTLAVLVERSLEVKLRTIWTDEAAEVGRVRDSQRRERKKIRSKRRENKKKDEERRSEKSQDE